MAAQRDGVVLATAPGSMDWDVLIGRSLAFCVHPFAAWSRLDVRGRSLLVGAYAAFGYASVLTTLLIL